MGDCGCCSSLLRRLLVCGYWLLCDLVTFQRACAYRLVCLCWFVRSCWFVVYLLLVACCCFCKFDRVDVLLLL